MAAPRLVALLQWLRPRLRARGALLAYALLAVYGLCGFYAAPALLRSQLRPLLPMRFFEVWVQAMAALQLPLLHA